MNLNRVASKNSVQVSSLPSNFFSLLNNELMKLIAQYLSLLELSRASKSCKINYRFFRPLLYEHLSSEGFKCVLHADIKGLVRIVNSQPEFLFQVIDKVCDPRNRIFYNVSPYQLIVFLCDTKMDEAIRTAVPSFWHTIMDDEISRMSNGGYDIVKLNEDPRLLDDNYFKYLTQFKQTYFWGKDHSRKEITFPLLENLDGIVYYLDENKIEHFFYANSKTTEIRKIEPRLESEQDQREWHKFQTSFMDMENNSARRSDNAEHQLISRVLQCTLYRKGINYDYKGKSYCDSRSPFNLVNAYRTCYRFLDEKKENVDAYWRKVIGKLQGEEIWLLQELCHKSTNFSAVYPETMLYTVYAERDSKFYDNFCPTEIVKDGILNQDLGSKFAISRVESNAHTSAAAPSKWELLFDLLNVATYVQEAKIGFQSKSKLEPEEQNSRTTPCNLI